MPWPVHPVGFFGSGDQDTYKVERSLRFNSADSAYLNRTPASSGNRKTWTWSGWVKRGALGSANYTLFSRWIDANNFANLRFTTSAGDELRWYEAAAGVAVSQRDTTQVLRDPSAWYHIVLAYDTTQAVAADRAKLYLNGNQITVFATTANRAQNADGLINEAGAHQIGALNATDYFNGYLTEINFIDGQALTPSSFGETDSITGRWKAKRYAGTYGTNGFYLNFADNSGTTATTLGKDLSGNGNNWTPNNFSVTAGAGNDSLLDSPTDSGTSGNYCTWNPLDTLSYSGSLGNGSISDGNLRSVSSSTSYSAAYSTFIVPNSGKFKFEATVVLIAAGSGNQLIGLTDRTNILLYWSHSAGIFSTGGTSNSTTYTTNDVLTFEIDRTAQTAVFYKNGTQIHSTAFTTQGNLWVISYNGLTSGAGFSVNFGQRPYQYGVSGFKTICTTNLPTPTIKKPSRYMDVKTYTGTGSSSSITGLDFSPDLVWIKNRGTTTNHAIYDTTRGTQLQLSTNSTAAEVTSSTGLTAFDINGFTIGTSSLVNTSGTQYVAWAWDEAPIAGMDIVSYTGNGVSGRTISHGLGVVPDMIIVKGRSGNTDWSVWHQSLTQTSGALWLNLTVPQSTYQNRFDSSGFTSSVFKTGSSDGELNTNNATYIAYLFAEIEGFSKFGSYTGNGSADGPFVWCGFRPRWVMVKRADVANSWVIMDSSRNTYNYSDSILWSDLSNAETSGGTTTSIDILSSGFKARGSGSSINASGGTYIFSAFAESPFKYARAR